MSLLVGSLANNPRYSLDFKCWHGYDFAGDIAAGRIKLALYRGNIGTYLSEVTLLDDPVTAFSSPAWGYYEYPTGPGPPLGPERHPVTSYQLTSGPVTFPSPTPYDMEPFGADPAWVGMYRDTGNPATSAFFIDQFTNVANALDGSPLTVHYGSFSNPRSGIVKDFSVAYNEGGDGAPNRSSHNRNGGYLVSGQLDWRVGPFKLVICNEIYGPHRRASYGVNYSAHVEATSFGLDAATWSPRNHRWLSEIPSEAILGISSRLYGRTEDTLSGFTGQDLWMEAHDVDIPVTADGTIWNALLFLDTGNPATSPLLCALPPTNVDLNIGLPFDPPAPIYEPHATVTAGDLAMANFSGRGESEWGRGTNEIEWSISTQVVDF